jgi:hypothetical protein
VRLRERQPVELPLDAVVPRGALGGAWLQPAEADSRNQLCLLERASFAPFVHGRAGTLRSHHWFVRWRTEQWDTDPIPYTVNGVGSLFGLEHGKCTQQSSQLACLLLVRTLPPRVSASSSMGRCRSARRTLSLTGKSRRGWISVTAILRWPQKALSRGDGQSRLGHQAAAQPTRSHRIPATGKYREQSACCLRLRC